MNTASPIAPASEKRQSMGRRALWSLAGFGVNYLLISLPFHYLTTHTHMGDWTKSGVSFAISTTIFFFWNYFVNFRTSSRKRDALPRYFTVACTMWAISTLTLVFFKAHDFHHHLTIIGRALDLDVIATQVLLGGFKFLLYHYWAFPVETKSDR